MNHLNNCPNCGAPIGRGRRLCNECTAERDPDCRAIIPSNHSAQITWQVLLDAFATIARPGRRHTDPARHVLLHTFSDAPAGAESVTDTTESP